MHKKAANQRHDFHFKLARKLCLEYDTICIEDLNVIGTLIVEVGRYFASSQLCNSCGEKNPQVKALSVRKWKCPKCGAHHDRDRNAAINILHEGLGQRPLQETLSDFAFIRSFGR